MSFEVIVNPKTNQIEVNGNIGYHLTLDPKILNSSNGDTQIFEPLISRLINEMRVALRDEVENACKQSYSISSETFCLDLRRMTPEEIEERRLAKLAENKKPEQEGK